MHRSIGEKLEVCSKGPVEWNSPVGLLEFRKSALQTDYEKAENKFVNEFYQHPLRTMWEIRPKCSLVDEEDKENIKMDHNIKTEADDYFDTRGAPAPAPWEKEKRVEIEPMKAKDKVPPTLKTDELHNVLAHLVEDAKEFKTDTPIFVPSRNDKNFPAQFAIMRFDKESGSHWMDSILSFAFNKRGDFDLETHSPSNISLGEVLNEAFCFDAEQSQPYDSDTEVKFRYSHPLLKLDVQSMRN